MKIQTELCHSEPSKAIVRVTAIENEIVLGSSLGEGITAEEAEDRAIARILNRVNENKTLCEQETYKNYSEDSKNNSITKRAITENKKEYKATHTIDSNNNDISVAINEGPPQDWSEELAEIDNELKRLNWDRDKEQIYLTRAFGHASRNRITKYEKIQALQQTLKDLQQGDSPEDATLPITRKNLLIECDNLLKDLNWNADTGRSFLQEKMNLNSRQNLNNSQLLEFNRLLQEQKK